MLSGKVSGEGRNWVSVTCHGKSEPKNNSQLVDSSRWNVCSNFKRFLFAVALEKADERIGTKRDFAVLKITVEVPNNEGKLEQKEKEFFGYIPYLLQSSKPLKDCTSQIKPELLRTSKI
jgi:hypothetical protein